MTKITLEFPDEMIPLLSNLAGFWSEERQGSRESVIAAWIQEIITEDAAANAQDYGYHPLTWERDLDPVPPSALSQEEDAPPRSAWTIQNAGGIS